MRKDILLYSGGKDSHYLLYKLLKSSIDPIILNYSFSSLNDNIRYFNSPCKKELIELHSELMNIDIFYFKDEKKLFNFFERDQSLFIKKFFSILNSMFGDFTLYFGYLKGGMNADRKKIKIMKDIEKSSNGRINIVFPFKDMDLSDIVLETEKCGIKSICIGIEKSELSKLLGMEINYNFLSLIKNKNIKGEHIQSFVIKSPLFKGKKIEITSARKKRIEDRFFLNIVNWIVK